VGAGGSASLPMRSLAVQAVRDVSFTVEDGEIFALLGPNGAGKTTTLEILEGFRTRDAGRVEVLGSFAQHTGLDWRDLGVLSAWGVVGGFVAIRRFRWDPRPE
jgi:ABC-type multidrug transport system ATPase subunit